MFGVVYNASNYSLGYSHVIEVCQRDSIWSRNFSLGQSHVIEVCQRDSISQLVLTYNSTICLHVHTK